jgi:hypothetical protein
MDFHIRNLSSPFSHLFSLVSDFEIGHTPIVILAINTSQSFYAWAIATSYTWKKMIGYQYECWFIQGVPMCGIYAWKAL